MASLNKVLIVGNLTKEPELRRTAQGTSVVSLSVAVNESYKDKSGEWKKSTIFLNVVAWGGIADYANKNCHKGTPVFVEGKLQTRSYEGKDGQKRYITEINASSLQALTGGRNDSGDTGEGDHSGSNKSSGGNAASDYFGGDDMADGVPF